MRTISHSDLRNGSAKILREVEAGETMLVTNRGRTVAVIGPADTAPQGTPRLLRPATTTLATVKRHKRETPSAAIIDELRGDH